VGERTMIVVVVLSFIGTMVVAFWAGAQWALDRL
jgi:hypothetical protein